MKTAIALAILVVGLATAQAAWLPESFPALPVEEAQVAQGEEQVEGESPELDEDRGWLISFVENYGDVIDLGSTAAIALFTIGLFISTYFLWKSTDKLWLETKRSGDNTERALVALESPQIVIQVGNSGITANSSGQMTLVGERFKYAVANYGRTTAPLNEIRTAYVIEASGVMPTPLSTSEGGRKLPSGIVSAPDIPYWETEKLLTVYDQRVLAPDAWKTLAIYFIAWVRYSDVFGSKFIVGCCYLFDPLENRFVMRGGEEHNYKRKEN